MRVAFLGEGGAFSEEAAVVLWPNATLLPRRSPAEVTRAVSDGEADAGVLPVENTVAGGVTAVYEALSVSPDLHAIAETVLHIRQCLVAPPGSKLEGIEVVESHPVALAQCGAFLATLGNIQERAAADTAGAARAVAESRDPRRAAIASRRAGLRYGLTILAHNIENRADNQTRFLAVGRTPASIPDNTPARTSLAFTTPNEPGGLVRALEPLARHELNMSKLESRPAGDPWTYRFFIDVDHLAGDPRLDAALAAIEEVTLTCRNVGTYARAVSSSESSPGRI